MIIFLFYFFIIWISSWKFEIGRSKEGLVSYSFMVVKYCKLPLLHFDNEASMQR